MVDPFNITLFSKPSTRKDKKIIFIKVGIKNGLVIRTKNEIFF